MEKAYTSSRNLIELSYRRSRTVVTKLLGPGSCQVLILDRHSYVQEPNLSDKPSTLLGPKRNVATPTSKSMVRDVAFVLMQVNIRRLDVRSRTVGPSQFPSGFILREGGQIGWSSHGALNMGPSEPAVRSGQFDAGRGPKILLCVDSTRYTLLCEDAGTPITSQVYFSKPVNSNHDPTHNSR